MSELNTCPFCGVHAYIQYEDIDGLYQWPVDFHGEKEPWAIIYAKHKDGCWLNESDVFNWFETADEAIETWNTRAESEQDKCNRERLVQIGEAVVKKETIHFLAGETYVPERTCKNDERDWENWFWCSECGFHCSVDTQCGETPMPFSGNPNYCPNCGAKVIGSSKYEQGASSAREVE